MQKKRKRWTEGKWQRAIGKSEGERNQGALEDRCVVAVPVGLPCVHNVVWAEGREDRMRRRRNKLELRKKGSERGRRRGGGRCMWLQQTC